MARNKGFMLIYPYFLFPNGFYKAYFRKFIVCLVTHVTMECSYTAFIRDQNATSENERRSAHEFSSEIRAITPTNTEIKNINPVGLGFFVEYENDESVNFIFKPEVIRNLDSKKLSASLAKSLAYKLESQGAQNGFGRMEEG